MRKIYLLSSFCFVFIAKSYCQYSLTTTTYSQDFNGLGTGSSSPAGGDLNIVSATLNGWFFSESGTAANTTITAGTGSSATGDSYNLGVAAAANRTLGGLQSGTLVPTRGFYFTNNNSSTITALAISYVGETWRIGATGRSDVLDFQYSLNATSLTTGVWVDVDALDYTNPSAGATASGSLLHSATISNSITGLNIAAGATVFIRWNDFNASGADDAMGVNDFSLTATLAPANTITTGAVLAPPFILATCGTPLAGTVAFTSTDVFAAGNTFTAQLSDDIGSFAAPINIGTLSLSGTGPSGVIPIIIPAGTVSGTGYRIRVISDMPSVTGSQSASFQVTQLGACASSHTDSYRSFQTGNWGVTTTWESQSIDNPTWIPATLVPTSLANTITIQNTHTVTVAANASADQVIIQSGGILEHSAGTFTLEDGTGDDINIQSGGVFLLSANSVRPVFGAGTPVINNSTGGTIRVSSTGQTGAASSGVGVNVANYVYQHQSILEYTITSPFSSSNVTFFPNVNTTTIPIFRTTNTGSIAVGASGANVTVINGVFDCQGAGVVWQGSATKTFRNGIIGSGPVDGQNGATASGQFIINGITAELGGNGLLTLPTAAGMQIGSASGTSVTVTANKVVNGNIDLVTTNTYIDLGVNNLVVSGNITNAGQNAHFVTSNTGMLALQVATSTPKEFPVGPTSANYNPVTITQAGATSFFAARVEVGINPPTGIFASYGVNRTWNLLAATATNVTARLQYEATDLNGGLTPTDDLEVIEYTGVSWSIVNGPLTPAGGGPYYVDASIAIPTSATPFAMGKAGGYILPVDCIINCQSSKVNHTGIISWDVSTCTEVNRFEVQKAVGGGAYQTIGTVIPGTPLHYSFTDASLAGGTNLYRIKIVANTGAVKYSNVVAIINDTKGVLITSLSPNPVSDQATMTINAAKEGSVNFVIYDIAGRPLKQWKENIAEGSNTVALRVNNFPGGIYYLSASDGSSKTVFRFVKQ